MTDSSSHSSLVIHVDEATQSFPKSLDHHGHIPMLAGLCDIMRIYGMSLVIGTQEPSRLSRTTWAVSWKACFRLNSGLDIRLAAEAMLLSYDQIALLQSLPQRQCVLALGRQKPILVEVADTTIQSVSQAIRTDYIPKKLAYSVAYVGGRLQEPSAPTRPSPPPARKTPQDANISPDAEKFLSFLARTDEWLGQRQLYARCGIPTDRAKAASKQLRKAGLVTDLKVREKPAGRPKIVTRPSARGWMHLGQDPTESSFHRVLQRLEGKRLSEQGLRVEFEFNNGRVRHDVVGRDQSGRLTTVSEIALTIHARLRAQITAAAEAGADKVCVVCCDGSDVGELQRLVKTLPGEVTRRVEIRPVRELIPGQADLSDESYRARKPTNE